MENALTLNSPVVSRQRVEELYHEQHQRFYCWTDRLFAWLLAGQWLAAILVAIWLSPLTWEGPQSSIHVHVYAASLLGLGIISLPIALVLIAPGASITRHTIAFAQALMSALLIHLTGGRIETHFHVFASLALLAFYRDWRVLLTASIVTAGDHFVRGLVWPQSVYGTALASPWRFAEHAGWVLMEDIFLILSCRASVREMWAGAERQASLEQANHAALESNEQLRAEIAQRKRAQEELEQATAAAEAANHAKSEFLANMSHELRTPLNAVIGFSDILAEEVCGPLNETQQEYVGDILESGKHLLSLVNDILDLAKIESGTMDMEWDTIALPGLIERIAQMFRERALRHGIRLRVELGPDLEAVRTDERRLKQLLYNFLSNALKFTPEGGEIVIDVRRLGDDVRISVADTGVGIPLAEQERIFESFYQVDSTLTKNQQGTGLGLALVRRIAEMHGGRVWLQSEVGEGSTFYVQWPGCQAPEDATPRSQLATTVRGSDEIY